MAQPAPGIAPEAALLLLAVSWSAVIVLVPANCPTKTFGAYVTVALDAVSYYASGEIPKGDPVTGDEPVIDQILAVEGNHFLGTFPNVDKVPSD